ncbi:MAG TPA: hypothetical protein VJS13_16200 [Pyrinomonadaceae bacterium]|nr:hypothetical protein [Pyrinomonadaceae bacterium]
MSIIAEDEKTELKRYLLGQLGEPDEERLEMRLLTEPAFVEEFDMMVDEIMASYVTGQFAGKEKEQVERYFLQSPERRQKLEFMAELLHQVDIAQVEPPAKARHDKRPVFAERVRAFFSGPNSLPRFATVAVAMVLLVGGGLWLSRSGGPTPGKSVPLTLAISDAERNTGPAPEIKSIKLPADTSELRLELLLPSQTTQPVRYRADFAPPANVQGVTIAGQDSRALVIAVPASELKPDRYAVRLFMIHADGQEERVPGSYYFRVE